MPILFQLGHPYPQPPGKLVPFLIGWERVLNLARKGSAIDQGRWQIQLCPCMINAVPSTTTRFRRASPLSLPGCLVLLYSFEIYIYLNNLDLAEERKR
jgi:hypothetical protein